MDNPIIVLTGSRHDERYRVDMNGVASWLHCACFMALVELVAVRIDSENGSVCLARSTVHRLRKELGPRVGKKLIERAGDGEYCLAIPKSKFGQRVGVTPGFFELVAHGVVNAATAERLRNNCRPCTLGEND